MNSLFLSLLELVHQFKMVNTRNRPGTPEGHVEVESTADRPEGPETNVQPQPRANLLGGGPEHIPRFNLENPNPVLTEVTPETRMMENMMRAMTAAMAQQQEQFMKILEDRDTSNRRHEAMAENLIGGSGGAGIGTPTNGVETVTIVPPGRTCSLKTFQSCKPPEFHGTDDPVKCMNWLREMEQAFHMCECGDNQKAKFASHMLKGAALIWWNVLVSSTEASVLSKLSWEGFKKKVLEEFCNERAMDRLEDEFRNLKKGNGTVRDYNRRFMEKMGLVGHIVPTEKEKIKAYIKGLPSDMMTIVRVSKASTLRGTIEEAQLFEDATCAEKEEKPKQEDKRKCEGNNLSFKKSRYDSKGKGTESRNEAKWCHRCQTKHYGPCRR
jgi:hypothetical protein